MLCLVVAQYLFAPRSNFASQPTCHILQSANCVKPNTGENTQESRNRGSWVSAFINISGENKVSKHRILPVIPSFLVLDDARTVGVGPVTEGVNVRGLRHAGEEERSSGPGYTSIQSDECDRDVRCLYKLKISVRKSIKTGKDCSRNRKPLKDSKSYNR